ncbi:MAG: hypothetical protein ACE5ID_03845 [Acidobacteriota bacterium]
MRFFEFHPRGREIRFQVVRDMSGGTDLEASARIVLLPQDDAPRVDFSPSLVPFSPELKTQRQWILVRGGEAVCYLPEGRYLALATAGPLDSVEQWMVPATGPVEHRFRIRREVQLPRHATVDFHVHGAASLDSLVPLMERVWSFLAAGVDILVATDHGTITDYRPLIKRTPAARGRIRSIPGVETGSLRKGQRHFGHWGVWPLEPDSSAPEGTNGRRTRRGALRPIRKEWQLRENPADESVPRMYEAYRRRAYELARRAGRLDQQTEPIIELNHPRGIDRHPQWPAPARVHDWFNKVEFRPDQPIPTAGDLEAPNGGLLRPAPGGTTGLDFDVLEIWNRNSRRLYMEVRRDWFALLNQGFVRTGVANTDTHSMARVLPGYPQNVVFLPPAVQGGPQVSNRDLAAAVRSGHVVGTDGPVPLLEVAAVPQETGSVAAGPGDLLSAPLGKVRVELEVQAASWVPLGPLRIWVNGEVVATRGPGTRHATVLLTLNEDAWILAEVGDPMAVPNGQPLPGIYGQVAPLGMALGFTNPVLVDQDGNGHFDPPGLKPASLLR